MINFNGTILNETTQISINNRGYAYGDALFETMKYQSKQLRFFEDHYFRLMRAMRIMRMEIPMHFTMAFLEAEILKTLAVNGLSNSTARVKLMVHRAPGGYYCPEDNNIEFFITTSLLDTLDYSITSTNYEVDLFKDFYVAPSLLSTLKTNNSALNVVGSIFAKENNLDNCLLLNTDKKVVEALNANLFLVQGSQIKTPPLSDGCLKGVMRKQLISIIKTLPDYEFSETSIGAFELQRADELFISNVILGIQPITKYRKKHFDTRFSKTILKTLNSSLV